MRLQSKNMLSQTAMNNYERILNDLVHGFHDGSIIPWCGAGISIPSGLPGADHLIEALLKNTALTPAQRQQVMGFVPQRLPFERLMEVVLDTMDETAKGGLLRLFTLGQPGIYHRFLAHLAKCGMLKTVCTTNFDPHIETAMNAYGLEREKTYRVWHQPERFSTINWQDSTIRLIKLHGSVDAIDKLGVTVRRIASPGASQHMLDPIKNVLDDKNSIVLVMGYSFSDRFDISPVFLKHLRTAAYIRLIVLEFTSTGDRKFRVTETYRDPRDRFKEKAHVLNEYPRTQFVYGDPAEIVKDLTTRLGCEPKIFSHDDLHVPKHSWNTYITDFFAKLDHRNNGIGKFYLAGALLSMIGDDRESVAYFKAALEVADQTDNPRMQLIALQGLAGALLRIGQPEQALASLNQARSFASRIADGQYSDHVLAQMGSVYHQLGDACYQHAKQIYDTALTIARKSDDPMRRVPHLAGIATSWMRLGDFDAAKQGFEQALPIVEESGDLYRRAELYGNIASMAYILRDYKSSLEWYERAIETSSLGGDGEREGIHRMNRANVYAKLTRYDEALDDYKKARELFKHILWKGHWMLVRLDHHEKIVVQLAKSTKPSAHGGET